VGTTGSGTGTAVSTGGKTLSDLRTMCQYAGWNDNSTNGLAALDDFINDTLRKLCTLAPWPEYLRHNGTVTLLNGDDDYTLETDDTYDNIAKVGSVVRDDRRAPIEEISVEEWLGLSTVTAAEGLPDYYALRKYSSDGHTLIEMLVYPCPTSTEEDAGATLYFTYTLPPTLLENTTATTDWPNDRMWLLSAAFSARISAKDRDPGGYSLYDIDFQKYVNRAFSHVKASYMPMPIVPIDVSVRGNRIIDNVKISITS